MHILSTISLLSCRRHQLYIQATQTHQNISHSQDFTGIVNLSELLSWPRWFQRLDVGTSVIRWFGRKRLLWNLGGDMQHREMQHNFLYFARDVTLYWGPSLPCFSWQGHAVAACFHGFFLSSFQVSLSFCAVHPYKEAAAWHWPNPLCSQLPSILRWALDPELAVSASPPCGSREYNQKRCGTNPWMDSWTWWRWTCTPKRQYREVLWNHGSLGCGNNLIAW